jgi:hypothetical protein
VHFRQRFYNVPWPVPLIETVHPLESPATVKESGPSADIQS